MMRAAAVSPWLRWIVPLVVVTLAWRMPADPEPPAVSASSGSHAWWVRTEGRAWVLEHVALQEDGRRSGVHLVATFDDRPVALAASGDRVWVAFEAADGRCEVIGGRAARNPASGLWFTVPPALRRAPSLVCPSEPVLGAVGDRLLAITPDGLQELVGERWVPRPLPEGVSPQACRLVGAQDGLWLLQSVQGGRWERWSLAEGAAVAWQAWPLEMDQVMHPVGGAVRLAWAGGQPPRLGLVEMGAVRSDLALPERMAVLGWSQGFAAVQVQGSQSWWADADATSAAFGAAVLLQGQASMADRWFHLPVLGVLSLGALMLAFATRMIRRSFANPHAPQQGMPPGPRMAALTLDALPCALAAWLASDAAWQQVLTPPLWSFNLGESLPFVWMTVGTVLFGFLEESAGGRSLGKRIFGGAVATPLGGRAGPGRHLVRNLLKGLAMLSPVVALPALVDRRGEGVAETLSGTRVITVVGPVDRG